MLGRWMMLILEAVVEKRFPRASLTAWQSNRNQNHKIHIRQISWLLNNGNHSQRLGSLQEWEIFSTFHYFLQLKPVSSLVSERMYDNWQPCRMLGNFELTLPGVSAMCSSGNSSLWTNFLVAIPYFRSISLNNCLTFRKLNLEIRMKFAQIV